MRIMGPESSTLSDERRDQLIELLAQRIEAMGLTAPAVLMLEANKPLSFVAGQLVLILQPILGFALDQSTSTDLSLLLEDRSNVERLIRRLERQRHDATRHLEGHTGSA